MPVCGEGGVKEREGMEEMDGEGEVGKRRWTEMAGDGMMYAHVV